MRYLYYYYRDEKKRPIITTCLLVDDEGVVSKGAAVCSALDVPCKKIGRAIAKTRAVFAQKEGGRREFERTKALEQIYACIGAPDPFRYPMAKCEPEPKLTVFESILVAAKWVSK